MSDRWGRIEDIYHRAMECDARQRHAFLTDACAGDEALLCEVESLLQHQNEAESLMEKPAVEIAAQSLAKDNRRVREGQQLGPYKILSLLGTGGMGEVYLADDTRLGRKAALKLLAPSLLNDSHSRALFMREARSASILNHPNICTLYDIGEHDGIDFLVMEYLQGETLAKRLNRGALPIDQALHCAIEIADALDKAHCHGITHRDLKPGNIMLTKSGAKLLDFGLAKVARVEKAQSEPAGLTPKGMILGTPQYMAPEQLEGKDADARTDIFAFGSVLYEMVTGQKAFQGTSDASLMAAILEHEPQPMSSLEGPPPISVERIVKVCLAKDPEDRWQSARDLCRELKWLAESDAFLKPGREPRLTGFSPFRLGLLILAVAVISGLGAWYGARRGVRQTSAILKRFVIDVPTPALVQAAVPLALSPDGSKLVYVGGSFESSQLYLRRLDQIDPKPLAGTLNARYTFFSPDGQWVGFGVAAGGLRKVPVNGGPVVSLCSSCPALAGASWGSDGMIYFGDMSGGLSKISADGGASERVTALDPGKGESGHVWPQLLPNGKGILFTVLTSDTAGTSRIAVQSFGANSRRIVLESGAYARYLPTGHLAYVQSGTLFAVPFDLDRIAITGQPVPVLEHVSMNSRNGSARFSFSEEGTLAFVEAVARDRRSLVWVNRRGEREPISAPARQFTHLSLSPDGKRLVVEVSQEGKTDLWLYDLATGAFNRMTFDGANFPVWTPDGTKITYSSVIGSKTALLWQAVDGSQTAEPLLSNRDSLGLWPGSWSPDGQTLAFMEQLTPANGGNGDINLLVLRGQRTVQPFINTAATEWGAKLSPDGRCMAYVSQETKQWEVYVRPFPHPGTPRQISSDGGVEVVWARNGQELFYRNGSLLMVAPIRTTPTCTAGPPKVLFDDHSYVLGEPGAHSYDVSPDGQHFAMITSGEEESKSQWIQVIVNWLDERIARVTGN